MLDKNTATPLYQQIVDYVREKIKSGEYQPGQILPSEAKFCEEFGVSRITVRNAIQMLVDEDLVVKHHGKGSFVTDWADRKMHETFQGFEDVCAQQHIQVYSHILSTRQIPGSQEILKELKQPAGSRVICIEHVNIANSVPAALERLYLPAEKYSFLLKRNLENQLLRKVIVSESSYDVKEVCVKHYRLDVALASEQEAEHLNINPGDPLFMVQSTLVLPDGTPLCFSKQLLPGSICSLTLSSRENNLNIHIDV